MKHTGRFIRALASRFGTELRDEETGCLLGKAFLVPWRGRFLVVGYTGLVPLRPVVRRDPHLHYWKLTVGFTGPREPDFSRESRQP